MRRDREERPGVVLVCAAGVVMAVAIAHSRSLAAHALGAGGGRLVVWGAGAVLASTMLLTAVRALLIARALRRRTTVVLLPTDAFDPSPEAVVRFAAGLASTRTIRGLLDRPVRAVRMRVDLDAEQRMRFAVELPSAARTPQSQQRDGAHRPRAVQPLGACGQPATKFDPAASAPAAARHAAGGGNLS